MITAQEKKRKMTSQSPIGTQDLVESGATMSDEASALPSSHSRQGITSTHPLGLANPGDSIDLRHNTGSSADSGTQPVNSESEPINEGLSQTQTLVKVDDRDVPSVSRCLKNANVGTALISPRQSKTTSTNHFILNTHSRKRHVRHRSIGSEENEDTQAFNQTNVTVDSDCDPLLSPLCSTRSYEHGDESNKLKPLAPSPYFTSKDVVKSLEEVALGDPFTGMQAHIPVRSLKRRQCSTSPPPPISPSSLSPLSPLLDSPAIDRRQSVASCALYSVRDIKGGGDQFQKCIQTLGSKLEHAIRANYRPEPCTSSRYLFRDFAGHLSMAIETFGAGNRPLHFVPSPRLWLTPFILPWFKVPEDCFNNSDCLVAFEEVCGWIPSICQLIGGNELLQSSIWDGVIDQLACSCPSISSNALNVAQVILSEASLDSNLLCRVLILRYIVPDFDHDHRDSFRQKRLALLERILKRIESEIAFLNCDTAEFSDMVREITHEMEYAHRAEGDGPTLQKTWELLVAARNLKSSLRSSQVVSPGAISYRSIYLRDDGGPTGHLDGSNKSISADLCGGTAGSKDKDRDTDSGVILSPPMDFNANNDNKYSFWRKIRARLSLKRLQGRLHSSSPYPWDSPSSQASAKSPEQHDSILTCRSNVQNIDGECSKQIMTV